jgi:hypothetical protein
MPRIPMIRLKTIFSKWYHQNSEVKTNSQLATYENFENGFLTFLVKKRWTTNTKRDLISGLNLGCKPIVQALFLNLHDLIMLVCNQSNQSFIICKDIHKAAGTHQRNNNQTLSNNIPIPINLINQFKC